MVIVSDHAATAIRDLTHQPQTPPGAGLRIAADAGQQRLALSVAAGPAEDDAVIETGGALLFLDPQAASALDDKALDAQTDADGQVRFTVEELFS